MTNPKNITIYKGADPPVRAYVVLIGRDVFRMSKNASELNGVNIHLGDITSFLGGLKAVLETEGKEQIDYADLSESTRRAIADRISAGFGGLPEAELPQICSGCGWILDTADCHCIEIRGTVTENLTIEKEVTLRVDPEELLGTGMDSVSVAEDWIRDEAYEKTIDTPDSGWIGIYTHSVDLSLDEETERLLENLDEQLYQNIEREENNE